LTNEQKAQVKSILSKFNAAALTAADAKAINEAFRNAGLRNGPELLDAIKSAGFVPERIGELAPPPDRPADGESPPDRPRPEGQGERREPPDRPRQGGGGGYSIDQAISDRAQLTTIAFIALAFLTGNLGSNMFLPPGKITDFFGFQFMRDVDKGELGHNTSFVPRIADNVLYILNDRQRRQLIALAKAQEPLIREFALKRFPLIKAFRRLLDGDLPAGCKGLDKEAVMKYAGEIFAIDGLLSYQRAEALGGILRSFDDQQKAALAKLAFNDSRTWPEKPDQVDKRSMPHDVHVAVMTYASEMFSWYAGSVDADVYFCPERHGTYFGSFYMKDIPAMGNPNYSISTSLGADSGDGFLAALTPAQREQITSLVELQRPALMEIVKTRRAISTELRRFIKEPAIDKDAVISLSKRYGELDGELSYYYVTHFVAVSKTLSGEQKKTLMKLRNLDGYDCKGAYIYSRPIPMPVIPNTDFLFTQRDLSATVGEPGKGSVGAKSPDDLMEEANKLEKGQKYGAALRVYEQLAQAKPGSEYEGFALKKIDELKKNPLARSLLADEAADKAAPGDAKRWLRAARLCESADQADKATSRCKEILSKYPETTYAQEARKILARLEASR